jgi:hypothetical protein
MPTGDPFCRNCGSQVLPCAFGNQCMYEGTTMSMRPKQEEWAFKPLSNVEAYSVGSREMGAALDSKSMRDMLAGYMGDDFFAQKFIECIDLIKVKNADYSQGEQKGDRIAAFRRIARDINITMEQAWAVFCQKHWGAVMKYVKQGTVESEPIEGRITDIINYMVLLSAIIDDNKEGEPEL